MAESFVEGALKPAAASVAQNAEPAAQMLTQEVLLPNAEDIAAEVRTLKTFNFEPFANVSRFVPRSMDSSTIRVTLLCHRCNLRLDV